MVGWWVGIGGHRRCLRQKSLAQPYEQRFGKLTSQAVEPMLDAVGVTGGGGTKVLDVACGPGYLAAAAAARGSDVVGLDFSGGG